MGFIFTFEYQAVITAIHSTSEGTSNGTTMMLAFRFGQCPLTNVSLN